MTAFQGQDLSGGQAPVPGAEFLWESGVVGRRAKGTAARFRDEGGRHGEVLFP